MTIAATPRTPAISTPSRTVITSPSSPSWAPALRKLTYQGKNVIATFGANEVAPASSGQLLIPYPNRIEDGVYTFEGKTYELPIDEHERRNAIHGYGYRAYWTLENLDESTVTLSWRVPNMAGYPFDVVVAVTYTLTDNGLNLTIAARNNGETNARGRWHSRALRRRVRRRDRRPERAVLADGARRHACDRRRPSAADRHRAGGRHEVRLPRADEARPAAPTTMRGPMSSTPRTAP